MPQKVHADVSLTLVPSVPESKQPQDKITSDLASRQRVYYFKWTCLLFCHKNISRCYLHSPFPSSQGPKPACPPGHQVHPHKAQSL